MAEVDIYRPIKTVYNIALYGAPWTEVYNPDNLESTASLEDRPAEDWHNFARCRSGTTEVQTEEDQEDSYDANAKKRIRTPNTKVTTRGQTYEMERQTVLYSAMFNGVKDPLSTETVTALSSGKGVQIGGTTNPRVKICLKEETYDDEQNLLFTRYQYGYLLTTGQQVSDGKISRPTLQFEEEASIYNTVVYSPYFLGTEA